ncbi:MAG: hypothetical protein HY897_01680 [Deltaproteobacteria bacterium]|nr:hypothetical protein [Deltaproteobacteria bacterium]
MDENGAQVATAGLFSLGGGFLWLLSAAIQLGCIIHVVRTGRPYWWILVIFWFPLLGAVAYLFVEVQPSVGKIDFRALLWRLKSPQQRIAICMERLQESDNVTNRLATADELHHARDFERECELLGEGLSGAFRDDATLLMRLAEAHLQAGRPDEAGRILAKTTPDQSPDQQMQFALLSTRVAAHHDRNGETEKKFEDLIAKKKSEAPRYYYAEYLMRNGKREQATQLLRDIIKKYRRGTPVWRFVERRWFYASKALLKTAQ